jgi:DNA (cytosine-5)-methyltransferase 1
MSEEEGNIFDIHELHKLTLKNIDLLTYSFPCQDLSQQGKQLGMSKKVNSRSGLL